MKTLNVIGELRSVFCHSYRGRVIVSQIEGSTIILSLTILFESSQ